MPKALKFNAVTKLALLCEFYKLVKLALKTYWIYKNIIYSHYVFFILLWYANWNFEHFTLTSWKQFIFCNTSLSFDHYPLLIMKYYWIIPLFICLHVSVIGQSVLPAYMNDFQADKSALQRLYHNSQSYAYLNRMDTLYDVWLESMKNLPYNELSISDQVDWIHFTNRIQFEQTQSALLKETLHANDPWLNFTFELDIFFKDRRRAKRPNAKLIAEYFSKAEVQINSKIKALQENKDWTNAAQIDQLSKSVVALQKQLEESYQFYAQYDPEFQWWVSTPYDRLYSKLTDYKDSIQKKYQSVTTTADLHGIIGIPLGDNALRAALISEWIDYTPEELIKEAEKEYEWCLNQIKKASQELGFNTDWKDAMEFVKSKYYPPGEWPQVIVNMANEAIEFVESRELISIPAMAKETWRTQMLSAEAQKMSPFFLGGESILIAYPTQSMSHEQKMMSLRGNNPHFARAVVHHELIPGHHLQQFMNQRNQTHRRAYGTPFWTEGWTLYWEFLLWEKGFAQSPEDRIGMLFWRMHRAARIIFSMNYHLGKMNPQQCIDLLVDRVGHERANAEAEVRRSIMGNYGPLYQIAYMVGGWQMWAFRKDMLAMGWTEKQFHDWVISQNNLPIKLLRTLAMNETLVGSELPDWKFLSSRP
jgi:uncharacterized protein (DUF885 family)